MMVAAPGANSDPTIESVFQSPQKIRLIGSLLLFLATLVLYNPVSRAPFLNYDDDYYIIQNSHVRAGLTSNTVAWAFQSTDLSNWHPLTWLSHALDVQLFGMNPAGHHYVNVLFHALNAILLFLFLERSTGLAWRSLFVAALFAAHPLNVESVAWISERKNVLSMTFFLLGLIAYVAYAHRPALRRYVLVALCFALGLMAKPQVITFPFVLLLMDYWPLGRIGSPLGPNQQQTSAMHPPPFSRLVLEKVPLLVLSVASAVITMKVQATATHVEFPLSVRLANAVLAYASYVGKAFWPVHLAPLYPHPGFSVSGTRAAIAALALPAITVLAIAARRRRYFPVGWLWFLGTLVPMVGVVQVGVQAMADRYAYIPLIGLFIVVCWGAADLLQAKAVPRLVLPVGSVIVLVILAIACHHQIDYWHDNLTLWTHTVEVTHNNFIAEDSIAMALVVQGHLEEAVPHFQTAVRINPKDPIGNLNLAIYEQQRGNYSAAVTRYQGVVQLTSNPQLLTMTLASLGSSFYALKQYDLAKQSYEAALRQSPENAQAFLGLGLLAQKSGAFSQAAEDYNRSVQFQPTDVGFLLLAHALEADGQTRAANAARSEAERISPDLDRARQSMAELLSN